jgi:dolichol-phosphate mannosyltransferase
MTVSTQLDYSIVTATLNEAENIGVLIEAIQQALKETSKSFEILVVDDNSSDATPALVRAYAARFPNVRLISRPSARGIGSAYFCGIEHSCGRVVCTMDADFSHPPASLPQLLAEADSGSLALGSRFLQKGDFETLWYRVLPTRLANLWHYILLRSKVRDHTNGYLAVRQDTLRSLLTMGETLNIQPFDRILYGLALVALARKAHVRIEEIRARYVFRTRGETKIKFWKGVGLFFKECVDSVHLCFRLRGPDLETI